MLSPSGWHQQRPHRDAGRLLLGGAEAVLSVLTSDAYLARAKAELSSFTANIARGQARGGLELFRGTEEPCGGAPSDDGGPDGWRSA